MNLRKGDEVYLDIHLTELRRITCCIGNIDYSLDTEAITNQSIKLLLAKNFTKKS